MADFIYDLLSFAAVSMFVSALGLWLMVLA